LEQIPPSAYFALRDGTRLHHFLLPRESSPRLFQAVLLAGSLLSTHARFDRYLTAYKCYECLAKQKDPGFSAIRHALSHATTVLSRPKTIDMLKQILGQVEIDFAIYKHQREFYKHLGLLIMHNDSLLHSLLLRSRASCRSLPGPTFAVHEWQAAKETERSGGAA